MRIELVEKIYYMEKFSGVDMVWVCAILNKGVSSQPLSLGPGKSPLRRKIRVHHGKAFGCGIVADRLEQRSEERRVGKECRL